MKSQSLPITTIALIIIVILALVVVVVFIITGFGQAREPTDDVMEHGWDRLLIAECLAKGQYYCPPDDICVDDCEDDCGQASYVLSNNVCVLE